VGECCIGDGYPACDYPNDTQLSAYFSQASRISPSLCKVLNDAYPAATANSPTFNQNGIVCENLSVHTEFDGWGGQCSVSSGTCQFTVPGASAGNIDGRWQVDYLNWMAY
jgi:hypothetical protein